MQLVILLPSLFIFLYCIYKLIKEDYVFMRKNVSPEQAFDVAFLVFFMGLVFSRLSYFLFNPEHQNIVVSFLTGKSMGFSFLGGVLGGFVTLFLVCKYKKIPLGRLSDFFTTAFLLALPIAFLLNSLLDKKILVLFNIFNAAIYILLALLFGKLLYPLLMQRKVKEGMLAILFLFCFSIISFGSSFLIASQKSIALFTSQNIILYMLFVFSIVLLLRQQSGKGRK